MLKSVLDKKKEVRARRKMRVRGKIFGTGSRPRISVFRSNKYFYAQAIDDEKGFVLASINGRALKLGNNKDNVKEIAKAFASDLSGKGIANIVFDRNGYLYHGVVAEFANTLRENGISF
ncbi:MAG: 50S ribosomal protein L18 [Helicobacter sp.]|nr:50S ribosomal protein L18 [Helicobacter sp.]